MEARSAATASLHPGTAAVSTLQSPSRRRAAHLHQLTTFRLSSLVSAKVSVSVCRYIVLQCELIMQGHTLVSPGVTGQDR